MPPVRAEGEEEACAAAAAARGDLQSPRRLAGTPGEEELHHARQVRGKSPPAPPAEVEAFPRRPRSGSCAFNAR